MNPYKIGGLLVLLAWSAFATTMWIRSSATSQLKCDNANLGATVKTLTPALAEQRKEPAAKDERIKESDKQIAEVTKTFKPIQEKVREITYDSCSAALPDRVQLGLSEAVDAANASRKLSGTGNR